MQYGGENVKCPYYSRESMYSITCEGIVSNSELATKFSDEKEKKIYMERNCNRYPNVCPIMRLLESKNESE